MSLLSLKDPQSEISSHVIPGSGRKGTKLLLRLWIRFAWSLVQTLAFRSLNSFPLARLIFGVAGNMCHCIIAQDRNSFSEHLFIKMFRGPSEWASTSHNTTIYSTQHQTNKKQTNKRSGLFDFSFSPLWESKMCRSSVGGMHTLFVFYWIISYLKILLFYLLTYYLTLIFKELDL